MAECYEYRVDWVKHEDLQCHLCECGAHKWYVICVLTNAPGWGMYTVIMERRTKKSMLNS